MNGYNRGFGKGRSPQPRKSSDDVVKKASSALGASPDEVKSAAQSGDLERLTAKLTPGQTQQLKSLLSDEEATKRLLATPQAQALLRSLSKHE